MAACEKCWSDAYHIAMTTGKTQAECYSELIEARKDNPCTPEQQAGPDAEVCKKCKRKTIHQILKECMNPECRKERSS
jgi:hypothetical protein